MSTETKSASFSPEMDTKKDPITQSLVLTLGKDKPRKQYLKINRVQFTFYKESEQERFHEFVLTHDPQNNVFWTRGCAVTVVRDITSRTFGSDQIDEQKAIELLRKRKPTMIEICIDKVLQSDVIRKKGLVNVSLVSDSLWQSDLIKNHAESFVIFKEWKDDIYCKGLCVKLGEDTTPESVALAIARAEAELKSEIESGALAIARAEAELKSEIKKEIIRIFNDLHFFDAHKRDT